MERGIRLRIQLVGGGCSTAARRGAIRCGGSTAALLCPHHPAKHRPIDGTEARLRTTGRTELQLIALIVVVNIVFYSHG